MSRHVCNEPGKLFCVNCDRTGELAAYPCEAVVLGGMGWFPSGVASYHTWHGRYFCWYWVVKDFAVATEIMLIETQAASRMRLHQWFGLGTGHTCLQLDCFQVVMGPWWCRWQKVGLLQLLWWLIILPSPPPSPFSNNLSTPERLKNQKDMFHLLFETFSRHKACPCVGMFWRRLHFKYNGSSVLPWRETAPIFQAAFRNWEGRREEIMLHNCLMCWSKDKLESN